jgi:outer membrane protein assembly factor BamB
MSSDITKPHRFPRTPIVVVLLWALLNGVCQSIEWNDGAIPYLILVSSSVLAVIALAIWPMTNRRLAPLLRFGPSAIVVLAIALFFTFFKMSHDGAMRIIIAYRFAPGDERLALEEDIKAVAAGIAAPIVSPRDFPQFLGPNRDGYIRGIQLDRDWKTSPPKLLWRKPVGVGWSGFAAIGPWAVTQEQRGENEMVTCYDVATGELRWSHSNNVRFTSTLGNDGPRATPTIHDGKVYALGATGILDCIDFVTGKHFWTHDIVEESGAEVDNWGKSGSPLVVDDKVIVSAGGPDGKSLVAYHKDTGERIWSGGDDRSAYASPTLMTLHGVTQVVIVNEDWIVGHDLASGAVLWKHPWPGKSDANASNSQPHHVGGPEPSGTIFVSKGYGVGAQVFEAVRTEDGGWETEVPVWGEGSNGRRVLKTKLSNVSIRDDFAYGLDDGILQCVNLFTMEESWKQGRFGHGQQLLVEDLLLVMAENTGKLALVEATPERFNKIAEFTALGRRKAWNNLCLVGNRLIVRNDEEAACYELPIRSP